MNLKSIFLSIFFPILLASVLLFTVDVEVGYGQRVVDTVNFRPGSLIGNNCYPNGMVYDRGLNRLFLSSSNGNSLSIVDCATGVVDNLPCGEFFGDLAINETTHRVYLLNRQPQTTNVIDRRLVVVDGVNKKVIATISIGGEGGRGGVEYFPKRLAVNEATNTIYVTDYLEDRLVVIDGITHAVSEIPVGPSPVDIAVNERTNKIFVVDEMEDILYFIDGTSQTILAKRNLPYRGVGYSTPMVNERLNRVYLVQGYNQDLISIDAYGYSIYRIITLSAEPYYRMAINETNGKIYIALRDGTIDVVRDRRSEVTNIVTSITDSEVLGIAIDEGRNLVYATQYAWPMQGKVVVIDGETDTELKTIDVGDWPRYIAINEDTNMLFVDNEDDCTISIINRDLGDAVTTSDKLGILLYDIDMNLNPSSPNYRRVYIDAYDTDSILIYNDSTGEVCPSTIPVGYGPVRVKVNDNLDKVYAICAENTIWVVTDDLTCGSSEVHAKPRQVTVISDPMFIFSPKSPQFKKFVDSLPPSPFKELASRLRENALAPPSERGMDSSGAGTIISDPDFWFRSRIEINKTTDKAYVLGTRRVMVIYSDDTYSIIDTYPFCPLRLDIDETRDRIYISGYDVYTGNGLVAVMDGSTDTFITQVIQVPKPDYIEVNEVTNIAYEGGLSTSPILSIIDGASFGVDELHLGWDAYCYRFTVNEASNRIYLNNLYRPHPDKMGPIPFIILDGSSKTTIPNSLQHGARWMKASDSQRMIYGASWDNRFLIIDDAVDESSISLSSVPVGNIPEGFVVNEATNTAFVLNLGSGTMSIIDTASSPSARVVVGQGEGGDSRVSVWNIITSAKEFNRKVFGPPNTEGEVHVARGDVDGDGVNEIICGQGYGGDSIVKVFEMDGTIIFNRSVFNGTNANGEVHVAAGDINGDGVDEIICAHGRGGNSRVKAYRLNGTVIFNRQVFGPANAQGEVHVAAGDVDSDSVDEIICGQGRGGSSLVKAYNLNGTVIFNHQVFGSGNTQGDVNVGAGDFDGDGDDEIICGHGYGGNSLVRVFQLDTSLMFKRKVFGSANANGEVHVAGGDVDGDGIAEVICGQGYGGSSRVKVFKLDETLIFNKMVFGPGNTNGEVHVGCK